MLTRRNSYKIPHVTYQAEAWLPPKGDVEPLNVQRIGDIQEQPGIPWLIDGLWVRQGVGFPLWEPEGL